MDKVKQQRNWMKSNFDEMEEGKSDQELRIPQPPLQKEYDKKGGIPIFVFNTSAVIYF